MQKRLILITLLVAVITTANAQAISYAQLQSIFNSWMQSKGKSISSISTQLKSVSPKWKLLSVKPTIKDDEKYYVWTALDTKTDTSAIALYIEEDDTTVKYSLRYGFHNVQLHKSLLQNFNTSAYYKGRITTTTDKSQGLITLLGSADDKLPVAKRIDLMLSDYNLNSNPTHPRLYTIDMFSRYISK